MTITTFRRFDQARNLLEMLERTGVVVTLHGPPGEEVIITACRLDAVPSDEVDESIRRLKRELIAVMTSERACGLRG